ncbi:TetR/AcrR family transcriptional regulator C-terminal domain-containing protein [Actinoplanes sp. KI2]|uniref:TetR/AcrR family transcriptional regulator n=1 Tax=Actinoplanes sp. KI2 TaxID=2983315 RepID=UPI0021D5D983|nr:TetR/AcrR family transcriptional regulator C-terminal domain-containing protein [Actinoplanes sp. KI2]MCU7727885.1 TetR/AcrR family transcriptional regulator C-terminal domain-containing protein [Actinoplanes sp. KI2]
MATTRATSPRVRRRPTRAGVVLDPDMIINAALRLIEAPGGNALTVRRLGVELGADPSAIYRYFRNIDALVIAISDRLLSETLDEFVPRPHWADSLRALAEGIYRTMLRHPRLALLGAVRFTAGPNELRAAEIGIGLLIGAGFAGSAAVRHYRDLIEAVWAMAAIAASEMTPEQERAEERALARAYATLSASEYPNLAGVRAELPAMSDPAFPGVLDKLIAALELSRAAAGESGPGHRRG